MQRFYSQVVTETERPSSTQSPSAAADRKLVEKVWEWLASHPDIWIGQNRKGNKLTLSEAEAREQLDGDVSGANDGLSSRSTTSKGNLGPFLENALAARPLDALIQSKPTVGFRIYTTQSRIWKSLTGHGVDFKRILAMEFQLLLAIAAAGPLGITQPDLVRATGQDKRSVPHRTEELDSKGYIVKKIVYEKGMKTSLLVLKRYITQPSTSNQPTQQTKERRNITSGVFVDGRLVLDNFMNFLVEKVDDGAVPLDNLIADLGVKDKKWERTMVHRCLDRLDIIGVISRFRTPIKVSEYKKRRVKSIKLLRQPTDTDRQKYHALTNELRARFRENLELQDAMRQGAGEAQSGIELDEEDEDVSTMIDPTMDDFRSPSFPSIDHVSGDNVDTARSQRILAQWDPALPYPNLLFNTIHPAGQRGLPSMNATSRTYGDFYTRSVDSMLGRLTDDWEHSQPKHLMHLALIRDTAVVNRTNYYLYRSYPSFQKAVEAGSAEWDGVRTSKSKPGSSLEPKLDLWGFPSIPAFELLRIDGSTSLANAVKSASREKTQEKEQKDGEPFIERDRHGNDIVVWPLAGRGKGRKRKRTDSEDLTPFSFDIEEIPSGTTSRPAQRSLMHSVLQTETPQPKKKYPRPETVKGMTWSEYNRQYSAKKRQEKLAQKRLDRIYRHAEWLVDQEEKAGLENEQAPTDGYGSAAKLVEVSQPPTPTPARGRKRRNPSGADDAKKKQKTHEASDNALLVTPVQNPTDSSRPLRQNVEQKRLRQDRIEQLVTELSNVSRNGLHFDPPGSRPHVGRPSTGKSLHALVVVFKFPWLKDLGWFESNPGTRYEPVQRSDGKSKQDDREALQAQAASAQLVAEMDATERRVTDTALQDSSAQQEIPDDATPQIQPLQAKETRGVCSTAPVGEWLIDLPENFELLVLRKANTLEQKELRSMARRPCAIPKNIEKYKNIDQRGRQAGKRKTASWKLDMRELERAKLDLPNSSDSNSHTVSQPMEEIDLPRATPATHEDIAHENHAESSTSANAVHDSDAAQPNQSLNSIACEANGNEGSNQAEPEQQDNAYALREQAMDSRARRKRGVGLGGGSSRARRIHIILDIVNKCGGVFGGDTEIIRAYQDYQITDPKEGEKAEGKSTVTDRDTILKALKAAVSDGKVRRATWAFTDKNGFAVTKKLLLRPDMRFDDPVAAEFRKKIEEAYPVQYIPDFLMKRKRGGIEKPQAKVISRYITVEDQENELGEEAQAQWIIDHHRRQEEMEKRREERRLQRMRDWWHNNKHQLPKTPRGRLKKLVRQEARDIATSLPKADGDAARTKRKYTRRVDAEAKEIAAYEAEARAIPGAMELGFFAFPKTAGSGSALGQVLKSWNYQRPVEQPRPTISTTRPSLSLLAPSTLSEAAGRFFRDTQTPILHGGAAPKSPLTTSTTSNGPPAQISQGRRHIAPRPPTLAPQPAAFGISQSTMPLHLGDQPVEYDIDNTMLGKQPLLPSAQSYSTGDDSSLPVAPVPLSGSLSAEGHTNTVGKPSRRKSCVQNNTSPIDTSATNTASARHGPLSEAFGDLRAWQKDGYDMCVVASGVSVGHALANQDNFVNFTLNHPQVTQASLNDSRNPHYAYRPGDHFTIYGSPNQGQKICLPNRFIDTDILPAPPAGVTLGPVPDPLQIRGMRPPFDPTRLVAPKPISTERGRVRSQDTLSTSTRPPPAAAAPKAGRIRVPKPKRPKDRNARVIRGDPTCVITSAAAKRLLFGVIAVRTLAGGPAQTIHWPSVHELFKGHDNFDETTFRKRWGIMLQYHRELVERVETAFQNAFVAAYEKDEVPRLNNEKPEEFDWDAIVKWASENVMIDSRDIDLPTSYEQFEKDFVVQEEHRWDHEAEMRERMNKEMSTTMLKEAITAELEISMPVATLAAKRGGGKNDGEFSTKEMHVAKSWARASITTSGNQYDAVLASAKLRQLEEPLLAKAIQELQDDKVIVRPQKGREKPSGGRNFYPSDHYNVEQTRKCIFVRQILRDHFVTAVSLKNKLDSIFAARIEADRFYVLPELADDGEILCIMELAAHGRVRINPRLPPTNNKFGHPQPRISAWGLGKELFYGAGKHIDMNLVRWPVEIRPTSSYVIGFPTMTALKNIKTPLAPADDDDGAQRIPYWVDIHGNIMQKEWENVLLTMVQLIATRAGSTIEILQKALRGLIWDWEIELVVDWLVQVGVARWIGDGSVSAREWWWSILVASV